MKVLDEYGKYRLVETLGNYMETRYEVQSQYRYLAKRGDTEFTTAWGLECWSHDLDRAREMFETRKREVIV